MNASAPVLGPSLVRDFERLGLTRGGTVLVHSSMRELGWVIGGASTVVHALLDVVGPTGTVVVPTHTSDNRDPSRWSHTSIPIPEAWWPAIRQHLPAYDPLRSPSNMGAIAECVRTWPGALRSDHPQTSFAAIGPHAGFITVGHELESPLGEQSPLARLEDLDAQVLLLGVGFDRCTAFHLAEYRIPGAPIRENAAVMMTAEGRRWVPYKAVHSSADDFVELGRDFESEPGSVLISTVGNAAARLLRIRPAIRFALGWMTEHRRNRPMVGTEPRAESGIPMIEDPSVSTGTPMPGEVPLLSFVAGDDQSPLAHAIRRVAYDATHGRDVVTFHNSSPGVVEAMPPLP